MTNEQKILIKKFLYSIKNSVMSMDVESLKDDQLNEVFSSLSMLVSSFSNENVEDDIEH